MTSLGLAPCKEYRGRDLAGAARNVWTAAYGPVAPSLYVRPHCSTERCIEPTHLYVTTEGLRIPAHNMRAKAKRRECQLTFKVTTRRVAPAAATFAIALLALVMLLGVASPAAAGEPYSASYEAEKSEPPITYDLPRPSEVVAAAVPDDTHLVANDYQVATQQPPEAEVVRALRVAEPVVESRPTMSVAIGRYVSIPTVRETATAVGWASTARLVPVGLCESGVDTDRDGVRDAFDPLATGSAGERGVMQIHPAHARAGGIIARLGYTWDQMYEVGPNLAVALAIYLAGGWGAWSCA